MTATNPAVASGPVRFLHWSMAGLIFGLYALGLAVEEFPRGAARDFGMLLHQSFGLVVAGLLLVRLALRPPVARGEGGYARLAARATHLSLYALMALVPLSGLANRWTRGRAVSFFGLFDVPSPLPVDRVLSKIFGGLHEAGATAIVVVVAFHAAAALWHHFVVRDDVLRAMLPGRPAAR